MTAFEISQRALARIDDLAVGSVAPDSAGGAVAPELLAAINEAQELFSLLTLCLETTLPLTLTASTTFAAIRGTFPDFLCPLRLMIGGARVRPATLAQLDALDDNWQNTPGVPVRYGTLGFALYYVTPQPVADTVASLTYARSPQQLVGDSFPEIPEQFHQNLADYTVYRVRLKEGGQGLERGVKYLTAFLDAAQAHGDFVRARSRAAGYDTLPIELQTFDRSRLLPTAAATK